MLGMSFYVEYDYSEILKIILIHEMQKKDKSRYFVLLLFVAILIAANFLIKFSVKKKLKTMYSWEYEIAYPVKMYFNHYFECPKSYKDISSMTENDVEYQEYVSRMFVDYLSRKTNGKLKYIPLYNKNNLKREGFILVSAGFDGKMNNSINENNTVYTHNYKDNLSVYNPTDSILWNEYSPNLFNYFFGKKDLIFYAENSIETFKQQGIIKEVIANEEIIRSIKNESFRKKTRVWHFAVDSIHLENTYDNDSLDFEIDGYLLRLKMYVDQKINNNWDDMSFVGNIEFFNDSLRNVIFNNCIVIDSKN